MCVLRGRSSSGMKGSATAAAPVRHLLIFTGVQLVTLGLLAEMLSRTYHESQDKPIYAIRDLPKPSHRLRMNSLKSEA